MFSALEDLVFEFFNMYLRNSFLDMVLPLLESSLPVFLVAIVSLVIFAVYCKKTYGEMMCRLFLFFGMLGLSAFFAHEGSKIFSFERPRPYQEIAGTMYYDAKADSWMQAQYAMSEGYHPEVKEELAEELPADAENASDAAVSENTDETQEKVQTGNPLNPPKASNIKIIDGSAKLYPSSVLSISMAIAFVIALLMAKTSPYIYLFPLLIGWAQIYTGNVYLSDILMGWIVGILAVIVAWLCFALFFRFTGKNI